MVVVVLTVGGYCGVVVVVVAVTSVISVIESDVLRISVPRSVFLAGWWGWLWWLWWYLGCIGCDGGGGWVFVVVWW